jgi:hypothetical protein
MYCDVNGGNLNCGILTAAIILSHSTNDCSHEVFNYEPPTASSHQELSENELQSLLQTLDLTHGKTQRSVLLLTSRVAGV